MMIVLQTCGIHTQPGYYVILIMFFRLCLSQRSGPIGNILGYYPDTRQSTNQVYISQSPNLNYYKSYPSQNYYNSYPNQNYYNAYLNQNNYNSYPNQFYYNSYPNQNYYNSYPNQFYYNSYPTQNYYNSYPNQNYYYPYINQISYNQYPVQDNIQNQIPYNILYIIWRNYLYRIRLWNLKSRCPSTCVSNHGFVGWCLSLITCFVRGGIISGKCKRRIGFGVCCLSKRLYGYLIANSTSTVTTEDNECGTTISRPPLIIGGKVAAEGEFPWQVSVREVNRDGSTYKCGGAILHRRWIVTAGHCIENAERGLIVRAGTIFFENYNSTDFIESLVKDVYFHNDYDPGTVRNDIALLELETELPYTNDIRPICLPPNMDLDGKMAVLTGWGRTSNDDRNMSQNLLKVEIPIIPNNVCQQWIQKQGSAISIEDTLICTGFEKGGKDTCPGDSGGPVQMKVKDRWVIIGIVSFGLECGKPLVPGFHTYIKKYNDWILNTTKNEVYLRNFFDGNSTKPNKPKGYNGPLVNPICYL